MSKIFKLAGSLIMYLAVMNLMSCKETEYILPPEVTIQIPEAGLSVALGESVDISANVKNADSGAAYQWSVNGIKVSTERVLHFEGNEPGNNTIKLTVTTENGTATDATNVLVARGEIDASISVVGDRKPEIEYLDSLVLRGNVFCREDYEVEWLIDDKRVSKEHYYVFKALKEGVHKVTFKALDVNGKFATDDIEIKVNVPVLDVVIDEPEYGFRTPVGTPITLHGEANRISDVQYEWIVNGKVVSTEQDYTLPGDNLDLVEVTLKVTDPTQTASTKVTVDVHNVTQYGTYIVSKKDFHFVDYAGRVTMNIYTAANPDLDVNKVNLSGTSDYNDKYFVYQANKTTSTVSGQRDTKVEINIIDLKTLNLARTITTSFAGNANSSSSNCMLTLANGKLFYVAIITDNQYKREDESGIYEIDLNTGEKKIIYNLTDRKPVRFFTYNENLYLFFTNANNTPYLVSIDSSTEEIILPAKYSSFYYDMDMRSYYTITKDGMYKNISGYASFFDLKGSSSTILFENMSPRLDFINLCEYNGYIYACNNGFLGRIKAIDPESESRVTVPFEYIADLGSNADFSGYRLNDSYENLKITSDGIILVNWSTGSKSRLGIYSVKNPGTLIGTLDLPSELIYKFIEK